MDDIQELERELQQAGCPNEKARLCSLLAGLLLYSKPHRALEYCRRGVELGKELKNADTVAQNLTLRSLCHDHFGDYRAALADGFEALAIYEQKGDHEAVFRASLNIGVTFWHMGDFTRALDFFFQASRYAGHVDAADKGRVYLNIGNIYLALKNYDSAIDYYSRSLDLFDKQCFPSNRAQTLNNVAVVYNNQKKYDEAHRCFLEALALYRGCGHRSGISLTLNNIANLLFEQERFDEGKEVIRQSLAIAEETGDRRRIAGIYLSLGEVALMEMQYSQSILYLNNALAIAEEIGDRARQFEIHNHMANAFECRGEYRSALYHHRRFHELEKEVYSEEVDGKKRALMLQVEIEKADREKEVFRIRNSELADALNKVEQLNRQLTENNQALEEADKEKNELLAVVSHDLKNPLGTIMILAGILQNDAEKLSPDQVRRYAGDIRTTSMWMFELLMALLDNNAIESGKRTFVMQECSVQKVLALLKHDYRTRLLNKRLSLTVQAEKLVVLADNRALYQVLDNLLSNAVKFSPHGRPITITAEPGPEVQPNINGDDRVSSTVRISVRDEGPGLTENDKKKLFKKFVRLSAQPTGGEHSTGLGLSIVKKLVEAMNGSVWCESTAGNGAAFIVELPRVETTTEENDETATDKANIEGYADTTAGSVVFDE